MRLHGCSFEKVATKANRDRWKSNCLQWMDLQNVPTPGYRYDTQANPSIFFDHHYSTSTPTTSLSDGTAFKCGAPIIKCRDSFTTVLLSLRTVPYLLCSAHSAPYSFSPNIHRSNLVQIFLFFLFLCFNFINKPFKKIFSKTELFGHASRVAALSCHASSGGVRRGCFHFSCVWRDRII